MNVDWDKVSTLTSREGATTYWRPYGIPEVMSVGNSAISGAPQMPRWQDPGKVAISVALNGAFFTRSENPYQVQMPEDIIASGKQCIDAGAQIVHVHVRDEKGYNVLDYGLFAEVLNELRAYKPGIALDACLVAVNDEEAGQMTKVLEQGLVRAVPVNTTALILGDNLFVKPPHTIIEKTRQLLAVGATPQLAVYTDGDIDNARRLLIDSGVVHTPLTWLLLAGLPGCSPMYSPQSMILGLTRQVELIRHVDPEAQIIVCAGGIAVPLGTRLGPADVAHILADSAPQVAITAAQWAGMFAGPQRPERVLLIDDDSGGDGDFFAQLSAPRTTLPPLARSEVAMIVYTSGTTGKPKGACLTHDNFIHTCLHYLYALAIDAPLRSLLVVPGTHIAGFGPVISVTLASAGTLIMQPQFKPDEVLGVMARERITYTVLVPAMYQLLGLRSTLADFDLSAWKYGIYGGAIMPPATIERFSKVVPELRMINAYGATETCAVCTIMPPELTQSAPASVGLALECDDLLIVDDKGHPVAVGESGELWIRGPNVSPGYWNNPAATDSAFANGYWKSGDVGHRDANGLIYVSDRLKDMINRGGFKVFSAEVENTLLTHPEVDDCAVVAVPDPVLGEKSWAKITTHSSTLNAVALRSWLLERIADYKVPDFWNLGPEPVPRNQNGKVQKGQLRDTAMAEVATTSARSSTHFPPN